MLKESHVFLIYNVSLKTMPTRQMIMVQKPLIISYYMV